MRNEPLDPEDRFTLLALLILVSAITFIVALAIVQSTATEPSLSDMVKQGQQSDRCLEDEITVLTYEPTLDDVSWVCVQWKVLFPRK